MYPQMNPKIKLTALSVLLSFSLPSQALLITSGDISTENIGEFEANVEWSGDDLSVALTNTSPLANGGYITGFLINLPSGASFEVAWTDSGLEFLAATDSAYSGAPYGSFDYGYALGGNFLGGGKPSIGIGVGETGNFLFSDWESVEGLTEEDFVAHFDHDEPNASNFLVRFRGFEDGGSDKVMGGYEDEPEIDIPGLPTPPSSAEIPEPNSLVLFLLGILCVVGIKKGKFLRRFSSEA